MSKVSRKVIFFGVSIRQNQFNLLVYGQGSIKDKVCSLAKKLFSLLFLGSTFSKEKIFFSVNKEDLKPVIVSAESMYSFCSKIEEHL